MTGHDVENPLGRKGVKLNRVVLGNAEEDVIQDLVEQAVM